MRRLDHVLSRVAERGDALGADLLIDHLERKPAREPDLIVVARQRSGTMQAHNERSIQQSGPPPRRRGLAVAPHAARRSCRNEEVFAELVASDRQSTRAKQHPKGQNPRVECRREDSNFHGLSPTWPSTMRDYQFRHSDVAARSIGTPPPNPGSPPVLGSRIGSPAVPAATRRRGTNPRCSRYDRPAWGCA